MADSRTSAANFGPRDRRMLDMDTTYCNKAVRTNAESRASFRPDALTVVPFQAVEIAAVAQRIQQAVWGDILTPERGALRLGQLRQGFVQQRHGLFLIASPFRTHPHILHARLGGKMGYQCRVDVGEVPVQPRRFRTVAQSG